MSPREDLLQPTLGATAMGGGKLFSATTGYVAAFFGGPVAGAAVALANAWRLRRLRHDWLLLPAALLVEWLLQVALFRGGTGLLEAALGPVGPLLATRLTGLLFFSALYLLHRRFYRGAQVMGTGTANGIPLGILAIVLGIAVRAALQAWAPR